MHASLISCSCFRRVPRKRRIERTDVIYVYFTHITGFRRVPRKRRIESDVKSGVRKPMK